MKNRRAWALSLTAAWALAGCPEKAMPGVGDDAETKPDVVEEPKPGDDVVEPGDDVVSPDGGPQTDVPGLDARPGLDASMDAVKPPDDTVEPPDDTVEPVKDTPSADAPDARVRPSCAPFTATPRTDPCPGRADCGLPSHGRVDIAGATAARTELQVRVTLPAAVRTAIGSACDRLVFRTAAGAWAPHHVTDCAAGTVWVRVPSLAAGAATMLAMHYGGATAVPGADSYDDTFDAVPRTTAGVLGAYTFDEGTGSRTCPAAGAVPFDAYIHQTPYDDPQTDVATRPSLWSTETPPSPLDARARFTRGAHSLNFPRHAVLPAAGVMSPNRLVNWQSASSAPFNSARTQLTVGLWVYTESAANAFMDNFQTVVCYGMPDLATRMMTTPDAEVVDNSIFNPWAIFFRSDNDDDTLFQGNSCVEPCTNVVQYAHITTRTPLSSAEFAHRWHFMAITVDTTTRPYTTRRSFFDDHVYEFPTDLDLFPEDINCPMGPGMCRRPPEAPIMYYPAPVMIGADMNDGEPQLGLEGKIDDFFILSRAASPAEVQAFRERRQYTSDTLTATVTP